MHVEHRHGGSMRQGFKIDRDHIGRSLGGRLREGRSYITHDGDNWDEADTEPKRDPIPFRAYDDDGELYYEGRATDHDALLTMLDWLMGDSGVTYLKIHEGQGWEVFP